MAQPITTTPVPLPGASAHDAPAVDRQYRNHPDEIAALRRYIPDNSTAARCLAEDASDMLRWPRPSDAQVTLATAKALASIALSLTERQR